MSTTQVFALESSNIEKENSYEALTEPYEDEVYIEVLEIDNIMVYDEQNDEYRILLQLDDEGNLIYLYKYNGENNYQKGEMKTDLSSATTSDTELSYIGKEVFKLDSETCETSFVEGNSPERASLYRAIGYMKDFSDYRSPSSGRRLGSVTRNGLTANVTEYVDFDAWQVGYVNYNSGQLLLDIALNLDLGIGTVLDIVTHTSGLYAARSGRAGHYRGENISTKIVNFNLVTGTWYNAGIDTSYKVSIADRNFEAKVSYHRESYDYWNSYQYFANKALDNYFGR